MNESAKAVTDVLKAKDQAMKPHISVGRLQRMLTQ